MKLKKCQYPVEQELHEGMKKAAKKRGEKIEVIVNEAFAAYLNPPKAVESKITSEQIEKIKNDLNNAPIIPVSAESMTIQIIDKKAERDYFKGIYGRIIERYGTYGYIRSGDLKALIMEVKYNMNELNNLFRMGTTSAVYFKKAWIDPLLEHLGQIVIKVVKYQDERKSLKNSTLKQWFQLETPKPITTQIDKSVDVSDEMLRIENMRTALKFAI